MSFSGNGQRDPRKRNDPNLRLTVTSGAMTDGNAQAIPMSDMLNVVLDPMGTSMIVRGGLEIRQHYNVDRTSVPAGKCVIIKDTAPADVALGNQFTVIGPDDSVRDITFMRDRTQQEGVPIYNYVNFVETSLVTPQFVDGTAFVNVYRTATTAVQTVRLRGVAGTFAGNITWESDPTVAIADLDVEITFDPSSGDDPAGSNSQQFQFQAGGSHTGDPSSVFYFELYNPSTGLLLGDNARIAVSRLTN